MKKRALLKHGDIFYLKIGNQDKYILEGFYLMLKGNIIKYEIQIIYLSQFIV